MNSILNTDKFWQNLLRISNFDFTNEVCFLSEFFENNIKTEQDQFLIKNFLEVIGLEISELDNSYVILPIVDESILTKIESLALSYCKAESNPIGLITKNCIEKSGGDYLRLMELDQKISEKKLFEFEKNNGDTQIIRPNQILFIDNCFQLIGENLDSNGIINLELIDDYNIKFIVDNQKSNFSDGEFDEFIKSYMEMSENCFRFIVKLYSTYEGEADFKFLPMFSKYVTINEYGNRILAFNGQESNYLKQIFNSYRNTLEIIAPGKSSKKDEAA